MPGIAEVAARVVIAEIGVDMSTFPTAEHLASWAGLCPATTSPPASTARDTPHDPTSPPTTAGPSPWRSHQPAPTAGPAWWGTDRRTSHRGTTAGDAPPRTPLGHEMRTQRSGGEQLTVRTRRTLHPPIVFDPRPLRESNRSPPIAQQSPRAAGLDTRFRRDRPRTCLGRCMRTRRILREGS